MSKEWLGVILSKTICEELAGSLYKAEPNPSGIEGGNSGMTGLCAIMGAEKFTKGRQNSARAQAVANIQSIRPTNNLLINPLTDAATVVDPVAQVRTTIELKRYNPQDHRI